MSNQTFLVINAVFLALNFAMNVSVEERFLRVLSATGIMANTLGLCFSIFNIAFGAQPL